MEEMPLYDSSSNAFSAAQTLKVLYVAGVDRSGSTILGKVLGQIDGFFSVGEMQQIWRRGFIENWPCSCGATFEECPLWQGVIARAFGDRSQVDAEKLLTLRGRTLRSRHLLPMPPTRKSPQERVALIGSEYLRAVEKLYHAVHAVSQSRVIVDTSKAAAYGYILDTLPSIELYVLHLVRDSRAVAYSSAARRKVEPGLEGRQGGRMPYQGGAKVSLFWNERNYIIERTWGHNPKRYLYMRYEDFVESPKYAIERCLTFLGEEQSSLHAFVSEHDVLLGEIHNFSGNPGRFQKGITAIRASDEWKFKMDTLHKLSVTALTSPWLVRYRYPLFVRS
jgi:hypothetical protein